jgi:hypothetical protein
MPRQLARNVIDVGVCLLVAVATGTRFSVVASTPSEGNRASAPTFVYGKSTGCSDIIVYSENMAQTEVLSVQVRLDRKHLPTLSRPMIVDLARPADGVRVVVETYASASHERFCSDVIPMDAEKPVTWMARSGTLTVSADVEAVTSGGYNVTATLTDPGFEGPSGKRSRPSGLLVIKAVAGFPPAGG